MQRVMPQLASIIPHTAALLRPGRPGGGQWSLSRSRVFSDLANSGPALPANAGRVRQGPRFLGNEVVLKDGTVAKASLLSQEDAADLEKFFEGLSEDDLLGAARCGDPLLEGTDGLADKWCGEAWRSVGSRDERFVIVRAQVDGKSKIVGACMMKYYGQGSSSELLLTADGYKNKGVATLVKQAQFECARADGIEFMESRLIHEHSSYYASPGLAKLYSRAGGSLGMKCDRVPGVAVGVGDVPDSYRVRVSFRREGE